jgi:hypothetical protein
VLGGAARSGGNAAPDQARQTLQHITASAGKITDFTDAVPALTQFEHGYLK